MLPSLPNPNNSNKRSQHYARNHYNYNQLSLFGINQDAYPSVTHRRDSGQQVSATTTVDTEIQSQNNYVQLEAIDAVASSAGRNESEKGVAVGGHTPNDSKSQQIKMSDRKGTSFPPYMMMADVVTTRPKDDSHRTASHITDQQQHRSFLHLPKIEEKPSSRPSGVTATHMSSRIDISASSCKAHQHRLPTPPNHPLQLLAQRRNNNEMFSVKSDDAAELSATKQQHHYPARDDEHHKQPQQQLWSQQAEYKAYLSRPEIQSRYQQWHKYGCAAGTVTESNSNGQLRIDPQPPTVPGPVNLKQAEGNESKDVTAARTIVESQQERHLLPHNHVALDLEQRKRDQQPGRRAKIVVPNLH